MQDFVSLTNWNPSQTFDIYVYIYICTCKISHVAPLSSWTSCDAWALDYLHHIPNVDEGAAGAGHRLQMWTIKNSRIVVETNWLIYVSHLHCALDFAAVLVSDLDCYNLVWVCGSWRIFRYTCRIWMPWLSEMLRWPKQHGWRGHPSLALLQTLAFLYQIWWKLFVILLSWRIVRISSVWWCLLDTEWCRGRLLWIQLGSWECQALCLIFWQ